MSCLHSARRAYAVTCYLIVVRPKKENSSMNPHRQAETHDVPNGLSLSQPAATCRPNCRRLLNCSCNASGGRILNATRKEHTHTHTNCEKLHLCKRNICLKEPSPVLANLQDQFQGLYAAGLPAICVGTGHVQFYTSVSGVVVGLFLKHRQS